MLYSFPTRRSSDLDRYFYAFWVISNNDGKITSKRLAEITQTDKVFIVRIIKYLTEKEFIHRLKHPEDKRSFLLHFTEKGRNNIPAIKKALIEIYKIFTSAISADKKADFLSEITNIVNKIGTIESDRNVLEYKRLNN